MYRRGAAQSVNAECPSGKGPTTLIHRRIVNAGHNPFDDHTLVETLEQTAVLTDVTPWRCYVDRGYRMRLSTVIPEGRSPLVMSAPRREYRTPKREIKRRSAIEPVIEPCMLILKLYELREGVTGEAVRAWRRSPTDLVCRAAPRLIAHFEEYPEAGNAGLRMTRSKRQQLRGRGAW